jgi:hydroxymethylpyrimidine/phosphomethylpyrimidine kinase
MLDDFRPSVVLTVAGFDPTGSSGTVADVRTIAALGCRPAAAITSLTFQNSAGLFGAIHETGDSLRAQILPIIEEFNIAAVKIGMLPTRDVVAGIIRLVHENKLPAPVLDPVLRTSSGYDLIEEEAVELLMEELLPRARLVTPNIPEAQALTGLAIIDEDGMREAARSLRAIGARAVLIKGGHLAQPDEAEAIDILDDGEDIVTLRGEWIDSGPVRGTGCMLSSAIACHLGKGMSLEDAVGLAKHFVAEAMRAARKQKEFAARADAG